MRLAEFIDSHLDAIVGEWVEFARTINASGSMDLAALRDHAREILQATVTDMRSNQSEPEREAKGKGQKAYGDSELNDASDAHAANRLGWGFDLMEVVSEYRALRASVFRLWAKTAPDVSAFDVDDITRFNESMDQSLAKTIRSYSRGVEQARDTFLGILGHDLRNPLNAIKVAAQVLPRVPANSPDGQRFAATIGDAVGEMNTMIGDLLDFTRSRLGRGIPIQPGPVDLVELVGQLVAQFRVAHEHKTFRLNATGDATGQWDAARLRQAISNLIGNACRHGATGRPIAVAIDGTESVEVRISVRNDGPPIPADAMGRLFDPMTRGTRPADEPGQAGPTGSVGLGLFIAREVARAHGGTIDVASDEANGTTFTIRLPRHATATHK